MAKYSGGRSSYDEYDAYDALNADDFKQESYARDDDSPVRLHSLYDGRERSRSQGNSRGRRNSGRGRNASRSRTSGSAGAASRRNAGSFRGSSSGSAYDAYEEDRTYRSSGSRSTSRRSSYADPQMSRRTSGTGFYEDDYDFDRTYRRSIRDRREQEARAVREQQETKKKTGLSAVFGSKKKKEKKKDAFTLGSRNESSFVILATTILLLVLGLIMVTSSSYYYAYNTMGDSMYFFRRQFIWIIISIVAMVVVSRVPLAWFHRTSRVVYIFSVFCCVLVIFIGRTVNGSTRWLGVGSLSFQPSELAKLAVALFVAKLCEEKGEEIREFKTFFRILMIVGIPAALVAYQNLSSGIIIGMIGVIIMYLGGARIKHFILIVGPVAILVILTVTLPMVIHLDADSTGIGAFLYNFAYRSSRIRAWLNPFDYAMDEGYQTVQALYAVGSGGFFGRGLGQGIQKLGVIPYAYNDIIFAIVCEELGIFGAGIVVLLFSVFGYVGTRISIFAPNKFTAFLAAGLTGQITLQAVLNIAVNTNSMPPTGISLPFISYGGSSMLFLMASVGLILNISTYSRTPKELAAAEQSEVDRTASAE